ncbi:MAG TPA: TonB-dependent receptor [Rhizomicrobium sp.]|nr:TonB-dependent receptor [Rhizomicrobium sp.]
MRISLLSSAAALAICATTPAFAQAIGSGLQPEYVIVNAEREAADPGRADTRVTAARAREQINTVNTEDMLKYAPSLLVRKRHYGDTHDPVATRTSGVGASARNLIFVDGIMISAPIGNNNTSATPHFGVAAPHDISRIDVLYGPFAARYAGNSMGATINITTRMPEKFELYAGATGAVQQFAQYGSDMTVGTLQIAGGIGDRRGGFSWRLSANHLDSVGHPLVYATLARPAGPSAAGTVLTGAFNDRNRTGSPIVVVGAGGIESQMQDTVSLKLAYDFDDGSRLSYLASVFHQDNDSDVASYLRNAAGAVVYGGNSNIDGYNYNIAAGTFSNSTYNTQQTKLAQGLSLQSSRDGDFAWELLVSRFDYLTDKQRMPTASLPAAFTGGAGTVNRLNGTGWTTFDAGILWRGWEGHELSAGLHRDVESFSQIRRGLADWTRSAPGAVVNSARGRTATNAVWAQDIWSITDKVKLALGGRYEDWRAYDGNNFSAAPALNTNQPEISARTFSPKASLAWAAGESWRFTASFGMAYRMPTVTELYQAITTGTTLTVPNPHLKPEQGTDYELAAERRDDGGMVRLSLFQQDIGDALISQSAPLVAGSTTLFSYVQNVTQVRVRGFELVASRRDVLLMGLELQGSVTYAEGRVLDNPVFPASVGKFLPQIPAWRANALATWRPDEDWSISLGARYSDRSFGTIDNSDIVSQTYQGFAGYFVVDARAQYRLDGNWTISAGIDNLGNDKYFLFHPFPQRTFLMEIHYAQ